MSENDQTAPQGDTADTGETGRRGRRSSAEIRQAKIDEAIKLLTAEGYAVQKGTAEALTYTQKIERIKILLVEVSSLCDEVVASAASVDKAQKALALLQALV